MENSDNKTALNVAIEQIDAAMEQIHADLEQKEKKKKHFEVIGYLLSNGAHWNDIYGTTGKYDLSPFYYICGSGNMGLVQNYVENVIKVGRQNDTGIISSFFKKIFKLDNSSKVICLARG